MRFIVPAHMGDLDELLRRAAVIVERDLVERDSLPASVAIGEAQKLLLGIWRNGDDGLDAAQMTTVAALVISAIVRLGEAHGRQSSLPHLLSGVPLPAQAPPRASASTEELMVGMLDDLADALVVGGQASSDVQLEAVVDGLMNTVRQALALAQTAP